MTHQSRPSGFHPVRRDRLLQEAVHDSYKNKGKLSEPTLCTDCGAVFHGGRWQWSPKPEKAHQSCCPACHRIRDGFPAGYVTITGDFIGLHEQDILQLIRNHITISNPITSEIRETIKAGTLKLRKPMAARREGTVVARVCSITRYIPAPAAAS